MEEIEDEERRLLDASLEIAAANKAAAETAFVAGYSTFDAIIRIAQEQHCDLIVMASHGRRGLSSLLIGSETQKCWPTRRSRCWLYDELNGPCLPGGVPGKAGSG